VAGKGSVHGRCWREEIGDGEFSVAKAGGSVWWGHLLHILKGPIISRRLSAVDGSAGDPIGNGTLSRRCAIDRVASRSDGSWGRVLHQVDNQRRIVGGISLSVQEVARFLCALECLEMGDGGREAFVVAEAGLRHHLAVYEVFCEEQDVAHSLAIAVAG
jgi:hypothetical protein